MRHCHAYPGHDTQPGQRLREDWFPYLRGK